MNDDQLSAGFAPGAHAIDAYGRGGFRFAGMSHRGSLLLLPSGARAWPVSSPREITLEALAPTLAERPALEFLLIGTGEAPSGVPDELRMRFREAGISLDVMMTGPAARTYNVMLAESRRVGAALIAVA